MTIYSDLDLSFRTHPITKDITRLTDDDAIKRSAKNLLMTNYFESYFNSSKGTPLRNLLFEDILPMTEITLKRAIELVLSQYEPRFVFHDIKITTQPTRHFVNITIFYSTKYKEDLQQFDVILKRTR